MHLYYTYIPMIILAHSDSLGILVIVHTAYFRGTQPGWGTFQKNPCNLEFQDSLETHIPIWSKVF